MLFYEDFVKEIEAKKQEELTWKETEIFGLEKTKKLGGYGIAIPLTLIAGYEIFAAFYMKQYYLIAIALILFYFAYRQYRTMFLYKIKVNTVAKNFVFQQVEIDFESLEKLTLREAKLGKKVVTVLDFITKDKKQIVIPMYMERKIFLVRLLEKLLGARFSIKK